MQPKWTDRILDEVFDNLRANRPDLDPARLKRTRRLMGQAIRDVHVDGYEHLVDRLELPDPHDRHVLAAAVHAGAAVIVTRNLRDFPEGALRPWGIEAQHPDEFLAGLHQGHPGELGKIAVAIAQAWGGDAEAVDVVARLAVDAPRAAELVRQSFMSPST
ncbi:MAG: PIN domain-containing protein [Mobilicoccus sp.]|nr:PIN domain-containing protein [Mobilicoccus sp.]